MVFEAKLTGMYVAVYGLTSLQLCLTHFQQILLQKITKR